MGDDELDHRDKTKQLTVLKRNEDLGAEEIA